MEIGDDCRFKENKEQERPERDSRGRIRKLCH